MEAIKARMPAAKARIKIYCTASEALEIVLCTCLITEPISMFVMVGKRLTKSLIMLLFSGILMLVMYEFGSVLPMLGERIKKKFGEKLSHPTSLKLVTVA